MLQLVLAIECDSVLNLEDKYQEKANKNNNENTSHVFFNKDFLHKYNIATEIIIPILFLFDTLKTKAMLLSVQLLLLNALTTCVLLW